MSESDSPNRAEYGVEKKTEGKWILFRILLIAGYTLFAAVYFVICYISAFIPVVALLPLFLWILIFFTWRYVSVDCCWTFESGAMTFTTVYARRSRRIRRVRLNCRVSDALQIRACTGAVRGGRGLDFRSSVHAPDGVCMVLKRPGAPRPKHSTVLNGVPLDVPDTGTVTVCFDCTEKLWRLLCRFAPDAVTGEPPAFRC